MTPASAKTGPRIVFEALVRHWPDESAAGLRLAAMLCIGITRVAMAEWRANEAQRPLASYVDTYFAALGTVNTDEGQAPAGLPDT